ncbi:Hypothetical protein A7982_04348 [Minicystis rosea]|nr:Hypothetical protein A7982_04348 [Minicystis rosea]
MKLNCLFLCAFASLAIAGCDSQADPGYKGEPLASLQGTVVGDGSSAPAAEVILLWDVNDHPLVMVGTSAPVSGQFPASFTMPIYTPPPDEGLIVSDDTGNDKVGLAYILVAKAGTTQGKVSDLEQVQENTLGMSGQYVVVYVDHELDPGSWWESVLGGRPSAGYHLMEVVRKTPEQIAQIHACSQQYSDATSACYEACPQDDEASYEACVTSCDAQIPDPQCGSVHDTFHEAPDGFSTSIAVQLGALQGFDWY